MRLIDADTKLTVLMHDGEWYTEEMTVDDLISKFADETPPTIDAVPVRHGRWTADEAMYTYGEAQCSVCKTTFYADDLYMVGEKAQSEMPNYCPHCGAKMDGERKEDADK